VTRGYGREAGGAEPWLLEETAAMAPGAAARAGDEAVLLALRSGGPVAIGADRAAACRHAHAELAGTGQEPDLFLLDDGFQHRRLSRALDVVLVSGTEDRERLLPAGPLRETAAALARASAVVTVRAATDAPGKARALLDAAPATALRLDAIVRATGIVSSVSETSAEPLASLDGRRVVAVAGIARPGRFLRELEAAGAQISTAVLRRDHHRYSASDLAEIDAAAASADLVVTTEKDLVRLEGASFRAPLRALRIDLEIESTPAGELLAERAASLAAV
jgi:tetraacyldisaccharide 4'-kinase